MKNAALFQDQQQQRNQALIASSHYMRASIESEVLPFTLDPKAAVLTDEQSNILSALQKDAARIALGSLASLAKINELDHLGGGLELIPSLTMTLAMCNGVSRQYTIEHAHTSIGYYSALAALGYVDRKLVIEGFRRSLDIAGHVSWLPGGSELNGGRLGIMVPVAVGQALGLKAHHGDDALVFCHCGDAGWISGQALNGFIGSDLHKAPTVFIMHRNGIQLSNTTAHIIDKDPRTIIEALGVQIIEVTTLHDNHRLFAAYQEAAALARSGKPSLIYPVGFTSSGAVKVTLRSFGEQYGVKSELETFAAGHSVDMNTEVWVPGSLMSYRDLTPMFECVFYVNGLPGGSGHHDGHMKGRDLDTVLANPMLADTGAEKAVMAALQAQPKMKRTTTARPAPGSPNLVLSKTQLDAVELPPAGKAVSPRSGSQLGYAAVAKAFPHAFFTVSCDLDPSTKMDKAKALIADDHKFEMGITEQVSALMTDGLAMSSTKPQVNVFATFSAFFEGIAREAMELWRYQRNLNGVNEGLNATMHLSHVGACTGRDHFSGWSLDWITLAMGYLPYLHRFYAPADARAAFVAVKDLAGHYGGHIIGIPRDNLPILEKQDGSGPLWDQYSDWETVTVYRKQPGAKQAILAMGAPAFLAGEASDTLQAQGKAVDVLIVNGLPMDKGQLGKIMARYADGVVTIEDGLIGNPEVGLRGFASLAQSAGYDSGTPLGHVGIVDPTIAPSHGFDETWAHFGITAAALVEAVQTL